MDSCANDECVISALETIRKQAGESQIVLAIDRLDYTKGIPERLMSFQTLLERHAELRGKVTLIQAVVPSREQVPEYRDLKHQIETQVSKINGDYSRPGWIPIQYFYRSLSRIELRALYRSAHVAFVTPLKDGMNLVAKEFCAARTDNPGVLVLSEFAGAAQELKCGALVGGSDRRTNSPGRRFRRLLIVRTLSTIPPRLAPFLLFPFSMGIIPESRMDSWRGVVFAPQFPFQNIPV